MQIIRPIYIPVKLTKTPKVSVIILTKDKSEYLLKCLDSLILQQYKNLEIFVGDTGSSKKEYEIIKEYCVENNINYVYVGEYNFSKNNNDIVRKYVSKDSEFLFFLNNDVELLNNVIQQFLYVYEVFPKTGTVGSQLMFLEGAIQHQGIIIQDSQNVKGNYAFGHRAMWTWDFKFESPEIFFGNTGACMMIPKVLFEKYEMFNEDYLSCMQDVQLNFDCIRDGYLNVFVSQALGTHDESSTRKNDPTDKEKLQHDLKYINRYIFLNQFVEVDGKKIDVLESYYERNRKK